MRHEVQALGNNSGLKLSDESLLFSAVPYLHPPAGMLHSN
jgi:hypothetical protein